MNASQVLGLIGASLLALGAFLPAVTSPIGSLDLFRGGSGDGIFFVILAGVALALAFANRRRWLLLVGLLALILLLVTFSQTQQIIESTQQNLAGNPFRALAQFQIGSAWVVLLMGVASTICGGALGGKGSHPPGEPIQGQDALVDGMRRCPFCAEMIQKEAKLCRYCHSELQPERVPTPEPPTPIKRIPVGFIPDYCEGCGSKRIVTVVRDKQYLCEKCGREYELTERMPRF